MINSTNALTESFEQPENPIFSNIHILLLLIKYCFIILIYLTIIIKYNKLYYLIYISYFVDISFILFLNPDNACGFNNRSFFYKII